MPIKNCLTKITVPPDLQKYFDGKDVDNMSREEATKILLDYYKVVHTDLNNFKKSIGIKGSKYVSPDTFQKIKEINSEYDKKIAEVGKAAAEVPKQEASAPQLSNQDISGKPNENVKDVEWYHGTTKEFGEMSEDHLHNDLGLFFTSDKKLADEYTKETPFSKEDKKGRLVTVRVSPTKTYDIRFGRTNEREINNVFDALVSRTKNLKDADDYDTHPIADKLNKARGKMIAAQNVAEWKSAEADMYDTVIALSKAEGNKKFLSVLPLKQELIKLGFDSIRKVDDGADTLVVLDKKIITPSAPQLSKEAAKDDFGTKARVLAQQVREKGVLPSWMKAELPAGTKRKGIDINEAFARAIETFADVYDKGKDFAKAIKEGLKHLKQWYKDNNLPFDEAAMTENFSNEMSGKSSKISPAKEPPKARQEDSGDRMKDKGILNRLHQAKNVPQSAKKGFEEKGLKYKTASQKEAEVVAKAVIEAYGIEDAVLLAEAQKFDGDVNSLIYAESLNQLAEAETKATTTEEKIAIAKQFADIAIQYDEAARKGGRFTSAINYFYKKSSLGIKIKTETERSEEFKEWSKNKDKSWKEALEEMMKEPEAEAVFNTKVQEELKKERAAARALRIKRVDAAFDKAKDKFKGGGAMYSTVIPPQVITTALEGMKKAYHAGEAVAKLIEDAVDYISKELKDIPWDKDKFRKEWNETLAETGGKKEKLPEEKQAAVLERMRKKLKGMTDQQKEDIVRKSFKKIVENGALDYAEFKEIIGDVVGLGKMTDAEVAKLTSLIADMNKVEDLAKKVQEEDRTDKALDEYLAAKKQSEKIATELGALIHNKPKVGKRFLSLMQLDALGTVSLIINPIHNIINQATVRFPIGLQLSIFDKIVYEASKISNKKLGTKIIKPENDIIAAQAEFFKKAASGGKESIEQLFSGLTSFDYFQKEVYASQIKPAASAVDLWDYGRSSTLGNKIASFFGKEQIVRRKKLSKAAILDRAMQASPAGLYAEFVARALNIGDKYQRWGAEGGQAAVFAKYLGLKDIDYKIFMEFPKQEAYRVFKKEGMDDATAMKKAEDLVNRIIQQGAEATFQNDNLLTNLINGTVEKAQQFSPLAGGAVATIKMLNMPFVKTPLNAMWSLYNLVHPEIALVQSLVYATRAAKTKSPADIQNAKRWAAHAVTGMASMALLNVFKEAINGDNGEETTKKEREGEQFYEQQNSINMGKVWAIAKGQDPNQVNDGLIVDLKWMSNIGMLMAIQKERVDQMTDEQKENQASLFEEIWNNLSITGSHFMEKGVFANTGAMSQAITKGGRYGDSYFLNLLNMAGNTIQPATFAQMSRAQLPYYSTAKADKFYDQVTNSILQRSSLVRNMTGKEPPSKIGIWGDVVPRGGNWVTRQLGMSRQNKDNFAQVIFEDYKRTGNTQFFPSAVMPRIEDNGKSTKLNVEESMLLEVLVGQSRKNLIAPYVNDMAMLPGFDKKYSELTDEKKLKALSMIYEMGYGYGKDQFLEKFPQYKGEELPEAVQEIKDETESESSWFKGEVEQKVDSIRESKPKN